MTVIDLLMEALKFLESIFYGVVLMGAFVWLLAGLPVPGWLVTPDEPVKENDPPGEDGPTPTVAPSEPDRPDDS